MSVEITGLPLTPLSSKEANKDSTSQNDIRNGNNNTQNSNTVTSSSDSVTLTPRAEIMQVIEASVNSQPIDDNNRIEDLKLAIDTGQYNVNSLRVAEKFIQFESQFVV